MSRVVFAALAMLVVAVPVLAGQNPDIHIFVDFDPPNYVHRIDSPVSPFDTYLCVDTFGPSGGMRQVSVIWQTNSFGMAFAADYSMFHAAAQVIGAPDDLVTGWVIAAPDCVFPDGTGIVVVAKVPYFMTGTDIVGTITLLPNPIDGRLVTDCEFEADVWHESSNGGINTDPPQTPVEAASWGSIKALYR